MVDVYFYHTSASLIDIDCLHIKEITSYIIYRKTLWGSTEIVITSKVRPTPITQPILTTLTTSKLLEIYQHFQYSSHIWYSFDSITIAPSNVVPSTHSTQPCDFMPMADADISFKVRYWPDGIFIGEALIMIFTRSASYLMSKMNNVP